MNLSKVHRFMLFTLGHWYEEASKRVKDPLHIAIKKIDFVKIVLTGKFATKGERAIYKNLELLEKKKLIGYSNRELRLTDKGKKQYHAIKRDLHPYLNTIDMLEKRDPLSYSKRVQTKF